MVKCIHQDSESNCIGVNQLYLFAEDAVLLQQDGGSLPAEPRGCGQAHLVKGGGRNNAKTYSSGRL